MRPSEKNEKEIEQVHFLILKVSEDVPHLIRGVQKMHILFLGHSGTIQTDYFEPS